MRECCLVHRGYLSCLPNDFWEMHKCILIFAATCQLHLLALPEVYVAKVRRETQAIAESPTEPLLFSLFPSVAITLN